MVVWNFLKKVKIFDKKVKKSENIPDIGKARAEAEVDNWAAGAGTDGGALEGALAAGTDDGALETGGDGGALLALGTRSFMYLDSTTLTKMRKFLGILLVKGKYCTWRKVNSKVVKQNRSEPQYSKRPP